MMGMSVSPECLNEVYLRMNVCGANAAGFMVLNAAFSGTFGHGQRHSALGGLPAAPFASQPMSRVTIDLKLLAEFLTVEEAAEGLRGRFRPGAPGAHGARPPVSLARAIARVGGRRPPNAADTPKAGASASIPGLLTTP